MDAYAYLVCFVFAFSVGIIKGDVDPCDRPRFCDDGMLLPDPSSCQHYYQCNLGYDWPRQACGSDTYFHMDELRCVGIEVAKCAPSCPETTSGPSTTLSPGEVCPNVQLPCENGENYADIHDCQRYLRCMGTSLVEFWCTYDWEIYDIYTKQCDNIPPTGFDCSKRCIYYTTTEPPTTSEPASTSEHTEPEETTVTVHTTPEITDYDFPGSTKGDVDICDRPRFCDNNVLIPDPSSCQHYFQCNLGYEWVRSQCGADSYFHMYELRCVSINDVICAPRCPETTSGPFTTLPPAEVCPNVQLPCENGKNYADIHDCRRYLNCFAGMLETRICIQIHQIYDIYKETCADIPPTGFDCSKRCISSTTIAPPTTDGECEVRCPCSEPYIDDNCQPDIGKFCPPDHDHDPRPYKLPLPFDCDSYIICSPGYPIGNCPQGETFDPALQDCTDDQTCGNTDSPKRIGRLVTTANIPAMTEGACDVIHTPSQYIFKHVLNIASLDYILFSVKTCNDAHIALYDNDMNVDLYEIVIGGWYNNMSVIRREKQQDPPLAEYIKTDIVNCKEFRQFWITYNNGTIKVGKGSNPEKQIFMEYNDENPYSGIRNLGICTSLNASGEWCFPQA